MERRELRDALAGAGVPDDYYRIEGVHEPAPTPTDFLYLRKASDGVWETGAYERGACEVIARHPDEAAACGHLFHLLV